MLASSWLWAGLPSFLVALGAAGLLRRNARAKLAPRLAETAPVLGFLAGFMALVQGVPFFGDPAQHRVGEAAVLALGAGLGCALLPPGPRLSRWLAVGAALVAIYWQVPGGRLPLEDQFLALASAGLAVLILDRLVTLARSGGAAVLVLAVAALGLAAVAVGARAGLLGGMALALAAACAGWLAWAWPWGKAKLGAAAVISGGMVFAALGYALLQSAARPPWALVPLLACFWAETYLPRLPVLAKLGRKKPQRPLALAAAAALPALVAAVAAFLL